MINNINDLGVEVGGHCGKWCPSAFNSLELPSWMLYQDVQLLWDSGLVGVKAATHCRVQVEYWQGM
jgi:hypothetical protein